MNFCWKLTQKSKQKGIHFEKSFLILSIFLSQIGIRFYKNDDSKFQLKMTAIFVRKIIGKFS